MGTEHKEGQVHLNNALVETIRPIMYQAMKYWGKKPVNIWREFIDNYCPENGTVLDPFAGSDIVALEAAALGKKAISFDLNPMSSFFLEVLMTDTDEKVIKDEAQRIIDTVKASKEYEDTYMLSKQFVDDNSDWLPEEIKSHLNDSEGRIEIYNFYRYDNKATKIRTKTIDERPVDLPEIVVPEAKAQLFSDLDRNVIEDWYPTDRLPVNPSINERFIMGIGGRDVSYLWTNRNLALLARIFALINEADESVRLPLMGAFVHTLHLTTKMIYPRSERSNRKYSGSWGRADYMIRTKQLEQNPVIIFERGIFGREGIIKALADRKSRVNFDFARQSNRVNVYPRNGIKRNVLVNYGDIDVADLCDVVEEGSIDFIITDPPYGGLVQYMDLSMVWLVWLQHFDEKYKPELVGEITIKRGSISRHDYINRLVRAFKNMHTVLKDDGYMVVTFHHKDIQEWNNLMQALRHAGFVADKVTHQYNKRSGEANVSNPYGTSGSDFYIRCKKHSSVDFSDREESLAHFVLAKTIQIISERCEPTPFEFITNGLLPEMIQAGYLQFDEPAEQISKLLSRYITGQAPIFIVEKGENNGVGDAWWFNEPSKYIKHPDLPLSRRVEDTVISILRRNVSVKFDDVLAEIFKEYPNGLTPDVKSVTKVLEQYATKSNGKWKLKDSTIAEVTKHSLAIKDVTKLARRSEYMFHVGLREQHETIGDGMKLSELEGQHEIPYKDFGIQDQQQRSRIEQIDLAIFSERNFVFAVEIENTTDFAGAINRCSNLDAGISKLMVLPRSRKREFSRTALDPQFRNSFEEQNWRYVYMDDLNRLTRARDTTLEDLWMMAVRIEGR